MTTDELLQCYVTQVDRLNGQLRDILLEPKYNNGGSPAVMEIEKDLVRYRAHIFTLKQLIDYAPKETA